MSAIQAAGAGGSAPATRTNPALGERAGPAEEPVTLDDSSELAPDSAVSMTAALSRRAAIFLLAQQTEQYKMQARLDRIKMSFNAAQEEHAEMLREMNALRDMALEQAKKDEEVLKKYIAMI